MARKQYDLVELNRMIQEDPRNPRHLYYMAQTYNLLGEHEKAAKWFKMRFDSEFPGLEIERMDAGFEYARLLNFNLGAPWQEVEKAYLAAYECEPRRADPLYFIGIHYDIFDPKPELAFDYLRRAFELGYASETQFSLKPTLIFYFLPKHLANLCYHFKDVSLGLKACQQFLAHIDNPVIAKVVVQSDVAIMQQYQSWFTHLQKFKEASEHEYESREPPCIVFIVDGNWKPWNAESMAFEGLGGSETWAVELSRAMAAQTNYKIYVFCKLKETEVEKQTHSKVTFKPLHQVYDFLKSSITIKACIVSRFAEYLPLALEAKCDKVVYIMHDVAVADTMIPTDIDLVVTLTEWHRQQFLNLFGNTSSFATKTVVKGYGFPEAMRSESSHPMQSRNLKFIYSSFPNRGLLPLLRMWPRIRSIFPSATLEVFADLEGEWVNRVEPQMMAEIKEWVSGLGEACGVFVRGWVGKDVLYEAWKRADVWLYPCIFEETFCLTALEAAASHTLCIVPPLAGLSHTVRHGIFIEGDASSDAWADKTLSVLREMKDSNHYKHLTTMNKRWVMRYSWPSIAKDWLGMIGVESLPVVHVTHWAPILECVQYVQRFLGQTGSHILEIGPGKIRFPSATLVIDRDVGQFPNFLAMDIDGGHAPWEFETDHFDGGYARHVFEDLTEPSFALGEMMRVCRKGYVETPSIQAECSLGVNLDSSIRGYNHHVWIFWVDGRTNTLNLLPKIFVLNWVRQFVGETDTVMWLERHAVAWNSYYFWDKDDPLLQPNVKVHRTTAGILDVITRGWHHSLLNVSKMQCLLFEPIVIYHLMPSTDTMQRGLCNQIYGLVGRVSTSIAARDCADRPIIVHASGLGLDSGAAGQTLSQVFDLNMWLASFNVQLVDCGDRDLERCTPNDLIRHDRTETFDDLLATLKFTDRWHKLAKERIAQAAPERSFDSVIHLRLQEDMIAVVSHQQGLGRDVVLENGRRTYVEMIERVRGIRKMSNVLVLCDGDPDEVVCKHLGENHILYKDPGESALERAIVDLVAAAWHISPEAPAILCLESTFSYVLYCLRKGRPNGIPTLENCMIENVFKQKDRVH
jgi:glycosyltransferase involved in cell wall biosynthesis